MNIENKLKSLKEKLKNLESVAIAYSGGVDSTFLLKVAHDVLGDKVIAVTARSSTYPEREFKDAAKYAKEINANHIVIVSEELEIEGFSENPKNRCYFCKQELFKKIQGVAKINNVNFVLDGSNADDDNDYRPGMIAAKELNVLSPLKEASLTKNNIRELSKRMNIPTWNKPSFACLSSRFPYGNKITENKLKMVEKAEEFLLNIGFKQIRVRHHGEIARIEVAKEEREKFFNSQLMDDIDNKFKSLGFTYVALDLLGYRTGSMNEVLNEEDKIVE